MAADQQGKDLGEPLVAPHDFDGPVLKRSCTDIIWTILLILTWIVMTYIGSTATKTGDINLLLHPVDYDGRMCGVGEYANKPDLYYVRFDGTGVCVESCPTKTNTSTIYACIDENDIPSYLRDGSVSGLVNNGYGYCMLEYATQNVLGYCFFDDEEVESSFSISVAYDYVETAVEDVWLSRYYIIGFGFGCSLVLGYGFVFLLSLKGTVACLIWSAIWGIFLLMVVLGGCFLEKAREWSSSYSRAYSTTEVSVMYGIGAVLVILAILWLCLACSQKSQIHMASGIIYESAIAIIHMPFLMCLPVLEVIGWGIFASIWAVFVVYIMSSGNFVEVDDPGETFSHKEYEFAKGNTAKMVIFGIIMFWTSNFIISFGLMTTSMSTTTWYFTRDKEKTGSITVMKALCTTLWHHAGTAAYGSIVLVLVLPVRGFLTFWYDQVVKCGKCGRVFFCCCCCLLHCVEHCVRYTTKEAYAFTAIFSQNFYEGGKQCYFLLERNVNKMKTVTVIGGYILLMACVFGVLGTISLTYLCLNYKLGDELNGLLVPCAVSGLLSFFISYLVIEILGMVKTTMLICFLADIEMFKPHDRFVEQSLLNFMDQYEGGSDGSASERESLIGDDGGKHYQSHTISTFGEGKDYESHTVVTETWETTTETHS